jgi:hypothetical protein
VLQECGTICRAERLCRNSFFPIPSYGLLW